MVVLALLTTPELESQDPENAQAGREGYPGRWDLIRSIGVETGIETIMVDGSASTDALVASLAGVEVVVPLMAPQGLQGNLDLVPLALARRLPSLRLVQVLSAGTNELDIDGLSALGVTVANNGGANAIPVAEHAIALMLSVNRRMMQQWATASRGDWIKGIDYASFSEIAGKTVGIVGFGNIGRQVARRLNGWGCELIYHDVLELAVGRSGELGCEAVSGGLGELLDRSDIVSLHVPLTQSTRGLIGVSVIRSAPHRHQLVTTYPATPRRTQHSTRIFAVKEKDMAVIAHITGAGAAEDAAPRGADQHVPRACGGRGGVGGRPAERADCWGGAGRARAGAHRPGQPAAAPGELRTAGVGGGPIVVAAARHAE
jgi:hypothetical protein